MAKTSKEYTECPYCLEKILKGALKCKHCQSIQPAKRPNHDGNCPYCLEKVKPGAIICKHCKSRLDEKIGNDCDCGSGKDYPGQMNFSSPFQPDLPGGSPGIFGKKRCVTLNVPICSWVEDVDPIAGFNNGRWECKWERRTYCTPDWW